MNNTLSATANQLITFFDGTGFLGISELIRCLDQPDCDGYYISQVRVDNLHAVYKDCCGHGGFEYVRSRTCDRLEFFVHLAQGFEDFTKSEQIVINAVFLEITMAINGKGSRVLFDTFEVMLAP
jgi:hypothetical protein